MSDIQPQTALQELMEDVEAKFESMEYTIQSQAAQIASYEIQIAQHDSDLQEAEAKTFVHDVRSGVKLREKDEIILKLQTELAALRKDKEDDDERVRGVRTKWLAPQGSLARETATKRKRRDSTPEAAWNGGWRVSMQEEEWSPKPAAKKRASLLTASTGTVLDDFPMTDALLLPLQQGAYQDINAATGDWFQADYNDKGVEW
ncbi:MAG: hypothetical protein LQ346_002091 [Caloplaca aetnensis]|nr:MAG: hypothetical protein LQ346_002091 [Caloplaca aetnensis]